MEKDLISVQEPGAHNHPCHSLFLIDDNAVINPFFPSLPVAVLTTDSCFLSAYLSSFLSQ